MDRAILLSNLHTGAHPELGVKVASAPDPATLTRVVQGYIDAAAGGGIGSPFVQGFELAGAGAGASCRATVTLTKNLGWGLLTSVPCSLARVLFRRASTVGQINTVLDQMYVAIAAAGGSDAFVWQPRIVGTGRDGSYLIGILWCDGTIGSVALTETATATQGPFVAAQTILSLTIPQTPDGTVDTDENWVLRWRAVVNDVVGTGVILRVEYNAATIWEDDHAGVVTDWDSRAGVYSFSTSPLGPGQLDLIVEPRVGGNGVNVRQAYMRAEIANYNNSPS